jgi:hypothetical protein
MNVTQRIGDRIAQPNDESDVRAFLQRIGRRSETLANRLHRFGLSALCG